jgi:hypothetical protein
LVEGAYDDVSDHTDDLGARVGAVEVTAAANHTCSAAGLSSGQKRRAAVSLITVTRGAPATSVSVNARHASRNTERAK